MNKSSLFFITILSFFLAQFSSFAQTKEIYIYQIQLGAFKDKIDDIDWSPYKKLKDIGFVSTQSISLDTPKDDFTRVFIGKYIGQSTLNVKLAALQRRGFKDPKVIRDIPYVGQEGDLYTVQIGAYNSIDVSEFLEIPNLENVYIFYERGKHKILYGLFLNREDAEQALDNLEDLEYKGLIKKLR